MRKQHTESESLQCCRNVGVERWKLYKTDESVKEHLREPFAYKCPLRQDQLSDKMISGALLGYVQCDIEVTEHLKIQVSNYLPNSKNTEACRQNIGSLMQKYAEKQVLYTNRSE